MRVLQAGTAPNGLDVVALQVACDGGPLRLHDRPLATYDPADVQVPVKRVIDAIQAALAQTGYRQGGLAQGLGMGARVEAGAADAARLAIHDGHLLAKVGSLGRAFFPGWPGANHDEIIFIGMCSCEVLLLENSAGIVTSGQDVTGWPSGGSA